MVIFFPSPVYLEFYNHLSLGFGNFLLCFQFKTFSTLSLWCFSPSSMPLTQKLGLFLEHHFLFLFPLKCIIYLYWVILFLCLVFSLDLCFLHHLSISWGLPLGLLLGLLSFSGNEKKLNKPNSISFLCLGLSSSSPVSISWSILMSSPDCFKRIPIFLFNS